MSALATQRCLHHPVREAVARCPECGQFFCRECITEHDDRVICSTCLKRLAAVAEKKPRSFALLLRPAQVAAGVVMAVLFFYVVGRVLITIPASFHEGTLWQSSVFDAEN